MLDLRVVHVLRSIRPRAAWLPAAAVACLLLVMPVLTAGCGDTPQSTGSHAPLPPGPPELGGEDDAEIVQKGFPGVEEVGGRLRK